MTNMTASDAVKMHKASPQRVNIAVIQTGNKLYSLVMFSIIIIIIIMILFL